MSDLDEMALRSFGGSPGRYVKPGTPVDHSKYIVPSMPSPERAEAIASFYASPPLSAGERAEAQRTIAAWFDLPPDALGVPPEAVVGTSIRFVPLSVRTGGRRRRLAWRLSMVRERVAIRLAPWLEPH